MFLGSSRLKRSQFVPHILATHSICLAGCCTMAEFENVEVEEEIEALYISYLFCGGVAKRYDR